MESLAKPTTKNPHPAGSYEALEWATSQHDTATKPKVKAKTKTTVPKSKKVHENKESSLMEAYENAQKRQQQYAGGGMKQMFGL